MTVAVVADAHLGGQGGEAEALVDQLGSLSPRRCERLVILGDLFQAWVGSPRFETPTIAAVLGALGALGESGIEIHYVEGNRDFFIAESVYARLFASVGQEYAFRAGERRVLAVHGDGINEEDRLYRFWRRASKNFVVRWAAYGLPRGLAIALMNWFERQLSRTNFKHKRRMPLEVIEDYGRRRLREGHDVVLLGHFHEPWRQSFPEGEIVVLDAWFRARRIELLEGAAAGVRA